MSEDVTITIDERAPLPVARTRRSEPQARGSDGFGAHVLDALSIVVVVAALVAVGAALSERLRTAPEWPVLSWAVVAAAALRGAAFALRRRR